MKKDKVKKKVNKFDKVIPKLRKFKITAKADPKNARRLNKNKCVGDTESAVDLDFMRSMISASKNDTESQRERIASLSECNPSKVDITESYGYTKFPAPIMDYLDYIKSTKNNLKSWSDLKSFITTTDMFWKTMRDQSLNITIAIAVRFVDDHLRADHCLQDRSYYRNIIEAYIVELEREAEEAMNRFKARDVLLGLILDYSEHESNIEKSVKHSMKDSVKERSK